MVETKESNQLLNAIFTELDRNFDQIICWRRFLHENPELSFQEVKTAQFIAGKLRSFGLDVSTQVGGNGVIGVLQGNKQGRTIALRADFDALPITDEKQVVYKSTKLGLESCMLVVMMAIRQLYWE